MKWWNKVLLSVMSALVTLLLLELIVRVVPLWRDLDFQNRKHFVRGGQEGAPYTFKPNIDVQWSGLRVKANSLGLKDPREPGELKPNCEKILVIGSSIATGFGVDFEESFPRVLERELNNKNQGCYSVINGAQDAFAAEDKWIWLRKLFFIYSPDHVLWVETRYGYDDSMAVDQYGRLSSPASHSRQHRWVFDYWGQKSGVIDTKNYRKTFYHHPKPFLESSFLLRYLLVKWPNKTVPKCAGEDCLRVSWPVEHDGQVLSSLNFSPIYLSPKFEKKFHGSLIRASQFLKSQKVKMTLLPIDVFIDPKIFPQNEKPRIIDFSRLVGKNYQDFATKYSLVWDEHPNAKGHQLIGERLVTPFLYNLHVDPSPAQTEVRTQVRRAQEKTLTSFLDCQKGANIHTIVGGLLPDCVIGGARTVNLLLRKPGAQVLKMEGKWLGDEGAPLQLRIYGRDYTTRTTIDRENGDIVIADIVVAQESDELFDIELFCDTAVCPSFRMDRISLL